MSLLTGDNSRPSTTKLSAYTSEHGSSLRFLGEAFDTPHSSSRISPTGDVLDKRFLVALAKEDPKAKLSLTAAAQAKALREVLTKISDTHHPDVIAVWDKASTTALNHLAIVVKNNPAKTMSQILQRPDVVSALTQPYEHAAKQSESILTRAHSDAVSAVQKILGTDADPDPALLKSLIKDLHANARAMRDRIGRALADTTPKVNVKKHLASVASGASQRAGMSLTSAVWMPASQIAQQAASAPSKQILPKGKKQAKKKTTVLMWVAVIDERTCSQCKALHGTMVKPGKAFKTEGKTYMDLPLVGPPRHPHCRCVLVPAQI